MPHDRRVRRRNSRELDRVCGTRPERDRPPLRLGEDELVDLLHRLARELEPVRADPWADIGMALGGPGRDAAGARLRGAA